MRSKKGIIQFGIIAIALVVIIVGFLAFNPFKVRGEPATPTDDKSKVQVSPPPCPEGYVRGNDGNCIKLSTSIPSEPCPSGQARTIEGVCVALTCAQGQIRDINNQCAFPEWVSDPVLKECKPTGYFKSAYAYHKKKVGDSSSIFRGAPLSFQWVVTNQCEANIYLEAGLMQSGGLTILVAEPSRCDGSPHFAGKFVRGSSNTKFTSTQPAGIIDVAFFPQDYNKEETLKLTGGVYSDCLNRGGTTIAEVPLQSLSIRNSYTDTEITSSVTKII